MAHPPLGKVSCTHGCPFRAHKLKEFTKNSAKNRIYSTNPTSFMYKISGSNLI
jgi:hypothetical protein